jgi:hypothetical protein
MAWFDEPLSFFSAVFFIALSFSTILKSIFIIH